MQLSQVRNVGLPTSAEAKREVPAWTQDPKIFPLDWFSISRPNLIQQTKAYVSELSKWRNCPKIKTLSKLKAVVKRIMMFLHSHMSYLYGKSLLECDLEEDLISLVSLYMDMELRVLVIKKSGSNQAPGRNADVEVDANASKNDKLITDRISYWLYTILSGHEQRLDALLSTTTFSKYTRPVMDPIFRKVLTEMSDGPFSSINYVRHMLAFKIWRERALASDDAESEVLCSRVQQHLVPREYSFSPPLLRCLGKGENAREHARPHNVNLTDACRNFMKYCRELPDAAPEEINFEGIPLLDDDLGDEENEVNNLMLMITERKQKKSTISLSRAAPQIEAFIDLTIPKPQLNGIVPEEDIIDLTEEDEKPMRPFTSEETPESFSVVTPTSLKTILPSTSTILTPVPSSGCSCGQGASGTQLPTRCVASFRKPDLYSVNISCVCPARHQECHKCHNCQKQQLKENKSLPDRKYVGRCFKLSIENSYPSEDDVEVDSKPSTSAQDQLKVEIRSVGTVTCNINENEGRSQANQCCERIYSGTVPRCDCQNRTSDNNCETNPNRPNIVSCVPNMPHEILLQLPSTSQTDLNNFEMLDKRKPFQNILKHQIPKIKTLEEAFPENNLESTNDTKYLINTTKIEKLYSDLTELLPAVTEDDVSDPEEQSDVLDNIPVPETTEEFSCRTFDAHIEEEDYIDVDDVLTNFNQKDDLQETVVQNEDIFRLQQTAAETIGQTIEMLTEDLEQSINETSDLEINNTIFDDSPSHQIETLTESTIIFPESLSEELTSSIESEKEMFTEATITEENNRALLIETDERETTNDEREVIIDILEKIIECCVEKSKELEINETKTEEFIQEEALEDFIEDKNETKAIESSSTCLKIPEEKEEEIINYESTEKALITSEDVKVRGLETESKVTEEIIVESTENYVIKDLGTIEKAEMEIIHELVEEIINTCVRNEEQKVVTINESENFCLNETLVVKSFEENVEIDITENIVEEIVENEEKSKPDETKLIMGEKFSYNCDETEVDVRITNDAETVVEEIIEEIIEKCVEIQEAHDIQTSNKAELVEKLVESQIETTENPNLTPKPKLIEVTIERFIKPKKKKKTVDLEINELDKNSEFSAETVQHPEKLCETDSGNELLEIIIEQDQQVAEETEINECDDKLLEIIIEKRVDVEDKREIDTNEIVEKNTEEEETRGEEECELNDTVITAEGIETNHEPVSEETIDSCFESEHKREIETNSTFSEEISEDIPDKLNDEEEQTPEPEISQKIVGEEIITESLSEVQEEPSEIREVQVETVDESLERPVGNIETVETIENLKETDKELDNVEIKPSEEILQEFIPDTELTIETTECEVPAELEHPPQLEKEVVLPEQVPEAEPTVETVVSEIPVELELPPQLEKIEEPIPALSDETLTSNLTKDNYLEEINVNIEEPKIVEEHLQRKEVKGPEISVLDIQKETMESPTKHKVRKPRTSFEKKLSVLYDSNNGSLEPRKTRKRKIHALAEETIDTEDEQLPVVTKNNLLKPRRRGRSLKDDKTKKEFLSEAELISSITLEAETAEEIIISATLNVDGLKPNTTPEEAKGNLNNISKEMEHNLNDDSAETEKPKRRRKQNLKHTVREEKVVASSQTKLDKQRTKNGKKDKKLFVLCKNLSEKEIDILKKNVTTDETDTEKDKAVSGKEDDSKKGKTKKKDKTPNGEEKRRSRGRPPKIVANKLKFFSENFNLQNLDNSFEQNNVEMAEDDVPLAFRMHQNQKKTKHNKPDAEPSLDELKQKKFGKSYAKISKSDKSTKEDSIKKYKNKLEQFKFQQKPKDTKPKLEENSRMDNCLLETKAPYLPLKTCLKTYDPKRKSPDLFSVPDIIQTVIKRKKSVNFNNEVILTELDEEHYRETIINLLPEAPIHEPDVNRPEVIEKRQLDYLLRAEQIKIKKFREMEKSFELRERKLAMNEEKKNSVKPEVVKNTSAYINLSPKKVYSKKAREKLFSSKKDKAESDHEEEKKMKERKSDKLELVIETTEKQSPLASEPEQTDERTKMDVKIEEKTLHKDQEMVFEENLEKISSFELLSNQEVKVNVDKSPEVETSTKEVKFQETVLNNTHQDSSIKRDQMRNKDLRIKRSENSKIRGSVTKTKLPKIKFQFNKSLTKLRKNGKIHKSNEKTKQLISKFQERTMKLENHWRKLKIRRKLQKRNRRTKIENEILFPKQNLDKVEEKVDEFVENKIDLNKIEEEVTINTETNVSEPSEYEFLPLKQETLRIDQLESPKIDTSSAEMSYKPTNKIYEKQFEIFSEDEASNSELIIDTSAESSEAEEESKQTKSSNLEQKDQRTDEELEVLSSNSGKYTHRIAEIVDLDENKENLISKDENSKENSFVNISCSSSNQVQEEMVVDDVKLATQEEIPEKTDENSFENLFNSFTTQIQEVVVDDVKNDMKQEAQEEVITDIDMNDIKQDISEKSIKNSFESDVNSSTAQVQEEIILNEDRSDIQEETVAKVEQNVLEDEIREEVVMNDVEYDINTKLSENYTCLQHPIQQKELIMNDYTEGVVEFIDECYSEFHTDEINSEVAENELQIHPPAVELAVTVCLGFESCVLSQEKLPSEHAKETCVKCSVNGQHKDNKKVLVRGISKMEETDAEESLIAVNDIPAICYCQTVETYQQNHCNLLATVQTAEILTQENKNQMLDNYNLFILADTATNSIHLNTRTENNNIIDNSRHLEKDERCFVVTFPDKTVTSSKPTTSLSVLKKNNEEVSVNVQKISSGVSKGVMLENKIQALTEKAKNGVRGNRENWDDLCESLEEICKMEINTLTKTPSKEDLCVNISNPMDNPIIQPPNLENNIPIDIPNTALLHLTPDDDDFPIRTLIMPPVAPGPVPSTSKVLEKPDLDPGVVKNLFNAIASLTADEEITKNENENSGSVVSKESEQKKSKKGRPKISKTSYLLNKYKSTHESVNNSSNSQSKTSSTSPPSYIRSTKPMRMVTTRKRNLNNELPSPEPTKKVSASEKMFDKLLEEHRKELSEAKLKEETKKIPELSESISLDVKNDVLIVSIQKVDKTLPVLEELTTKESVPVPEENIPLPVLQYPSSEVVEVSEVPVAAEEVLLLSNQDLQEQVVEQTIPQQTVEITIDKIIEEAVESDQPPEVENISVDLPTQITEVVEIEQKSDKEVPCDEETPLVAPKTPETQENYSEGIDEQTPKTNDRTTAIEVVQNWFNRVENKETEPYSEIPYQTIEECNFFEEISNTSEDVRKTDEKERVYNEHLTPDSGIAFDEDSVQKDKSLTPIQETSESESETKSYFRNLEQKVKVSDLRIVKPTRSNTEFMNMRVSIALERIKDIIPILTHHKFQQQAMEMEKTKKRKHNEEITTIVCDVSKNKRKKHQEELVIQECVEEVVTATKSHKEIINLKTKGSVKEYPDCLFGITESPVPSGSFNSPYPSDISLSEEPTFYEEGGIDLCNDYPCYDSFEVLQEQQSIQREYNVDDNPKDVQQGLQAGYCVVDNQFLPLSEYMNDGEYILIDNKIFDDKRMMPVNMHQVQPETKPHTEDTKRNEFEDSEKEDSLSETVEEIIKNPNLFNEQTTEVEVISIDQATSEVQVVIGGDIQETEVENYLFDIPIPTETTTIPAETSSTEVSSQNVENIPEVQENITIVSPSEFSNSLQTIEHPEESMIVVANVETVGDLETISESIPEPVEQVVKVEDLPVVPETKSEKTECITPPKVVEKQEITSRRLSTGNPVPDLSIPSTSYSPKPVSPIQKPILPSKPQSSCTNPPQVIDKSTFNKPPCPKPKPSNIFVPNGDKHDLKNDSINDLHKDKRKYDYYHHHHRPVPKYHSTSISKPVVDPKSYPKPYPPTKTHSKIPLDAFDKLKQEKVNVPPPEKHKYYSSNVSDPNYMKSRYRKESLAELKRHPADRESPRSRYGTVIPTEAKRPQSAHSESVSTRPMYRLPPSDPTYRSSYHNKTPETTKSTNSKQPEMRHSSNPSVPSSHKDWLKNETLLNLIKTANTIYNKKY